MQNEKRFYPIYLEINRKGCFLPGGSNYRLNTCRLKETHKGNFNLYIM